MANPQQPQVSIQQMFGQTRQPSRRQFGRPAIPQPIIASFPQQIPVMMGMGNLGTNPPKIPILSKATNTVEMSKKEQDEIVMETNKRVAELPLLTIVKSSISLYSAEEMQRIAGAIKITNAQLQGYGSVNDPRMGVVSVNMRCEYCSEIDCPGHFGLIDFNGMIYNPAFIREIVSILTCVCNDCSHLLITRDVYEQQGFGKLSFEKRLAAMEDYCKKDVVCLRQKPETLGGPIISCARNPVFITTDIKDKGEITYKIPQERNRKVTANDPIHIKPIEQVYDILNGISEEDNKLLGFAGGISHRKLSAQFVIELLTRAKQFELSQAGFPPGVDVRTMDYNEVMKILDKVPAVYKKQFGFPTGSHCRNMILTHMLVPPTIARPPVYEGGSIHYDQLTIMYSYIVRKVLDKNNGKGTVGDNLYTAVKQLIFKTEGKKMGTREFLSILERIQGKSKLLRGLLMGKRNNFCGRTVAGPDSSTRFGEVRIPDSWTPVLTKKVKVTHTNRSYLNRLLEAGQITHITPNGTGLRRYYDSRYKYNLKIGDQVERWFQNGDRIIVNRQPTLHKQSMMGYHQVKGSQSTIGLNLAYTAPMNCDFDGDENNGWSPQDFEVEAETEILINVKHNVMSWENNKPIMGLVQNGPLGGYLLTKPDVIKKDALVNGVTANNAINYAVDLELLEQSINLNRPNLDLLSKLHDGPINNPFEIAQQILNTAQGNQQRLSQVCRQLVVDNNIIIGTRVDDDLFSELSQLITKPDRLLTLSQRLEKYGVHPRSGNAVFSLLLPEDFYYKQKGVIILEGVLISGRITKDHVGSSHRSIIQELWKDYGADVTADFFTESQWVINKWLLETGFSVGILDYINYDIDPVTNEEYDKNERVLKQELAKIYVQLADLGGEKEDELEEAARQKRINNLVNIANGIGLRLAKEVLSGDNAIGVMSDQGSKAKGNIGNIGQIMGAVGQQYYRSERLKPHITGKTRLLPTFDVNDQKPEANAFIPNSFWTGIGPEGLFFSQSGGREGLLDTALKTAETGDMQRRMIKSLENIIIANDGSVRNVMGTLFSPSFNCGYEIAEMVAVDSVHKSGLASFIDLVSTVSELNIKRGWVPPDVNRTIIVSRALNNALGVHNENILQRPDENYVKGPLVTDTSINYNVADVPAPQRSKLKINKYEKARLIGARATQLDENAVPLVDIPYNDEMSINDANKVLDPVNIAMREYELGILPIYVVRKFPDGSYEKVHPTLDNI